MGHPMDADIDRVLREEQHRLRDASAKRRRLVAAAQAWVDARDESDGEESRSALADLCDEARDIIAKLLHEMGEWRP